MKVVHLNTHSYGGAAVVARRLHNAALANGIKSKFITRYGLRSDPTPEYEALQDARLLYFLRRQSEHPRLHRLGKLTQRALQHRNLANRPEGFEVFSPLNEETRFADCVRDLDPDIIHLHWVNGFADSAEFFRRNAQRKFVWTLHDMNPMTGGCHHADGCMRFVDGCAECPQLAGTIDPHYAARVLEAKQHALAPLRDDQLVIVGPSRWILELSKQGAVTKRFRHVRIDNPARVACPSDPTAARKRSLGLPEDKKIVLFASDNLRNQRKGFARLVAAAQLLPSREQVHFVGIGQRMDWPARLAATFPGPIRDEDRLNEYFTCADLLVSPSVAENAPLVVIEALACGTPVVSYAVGGVPEMVDESCGTVVAEQSAQALAAALQDALFGRTFSRAAIRAAAQRFAPDVVFNAYAEVYAGLGRT